jgi:hypothetical protein
MEHYLQVIQDGRDELAFFPRETDTRAIENSKRPKLCKVVLGESYPGYQVASWCS